MRFRLTGLTAAALGSSGFGVTPAGAQTIDLSFTLPRLSVAEYHRPYVAVWLEKAGSAPRTLSILYDVDKRNNAGAKWLRDVRLWWRAAGRMLSVPADGVSGATRPAGSHTLSFTAGRGGMPALTPGNYVLVVEAAREAGGREAVRLPFTWSGTQATASTSGKFELGRVSLNARR
ncbi:DUF2271 domain-containing protein [Sphingomonas koreensis]|jgi:hypothetical protein|uniref:DUF2271 domain-containing protein n=4 Tax=Sphingomonadales TaxID=204457 RepID=A0A1L6J845_9SPHN|nr:MULTISPECIES: DUF2271 domain-containing protein [Pseudomonadota]MAF62156.1 DUF2271 domain-containing protein [Blastomonas sp.]OJY69983.1 MAG: hypothetical protein BGP16_09755 [Sphingobium sp. 66-54]QEH77870.1 DUF2271 domain-containing protein [Sphingomonas sp. C8-2]APR52088.1 hypothetical protein BRX40_06250 [Sphingomonas koreensis]KAA9016902.1 DUF2271 domain-containing protein [Sphingobium limneticum]|tara:strand:+ start:20668 stop:21192 length:525 start_codon:yes stop_codon:yes gene_type:complete